MPATTFDSSDIVYVSQTVSNSALTIGKTAAEIAAGGWTRALLTVESQSIRFTWDGTTPEATVGHQADAGDVIEVIGQQRLAAFRMIRKDGSDATVRTTLDFSEA